MLLHLPITLLCSLSILSITSKTTQMATESPLPILHYKNNDKGMRNDKGKDEQKVFSWCWITIKASMHLCRHYTSVWNSPEWMNNILSKLSFPQLMFWLWWCCLTHLSKISHWCPVVLSSGACESHSIKFTSFFYSSNNSVCPHTLWIGVLPFWMKALQSGLKCFIMG